MKDNDLRFKTARGSLIMGVVNILFRPINIFGAFFLLRLLDPADFGIVALALVLLNTSTTFSALGLETAIVQTSYEKQKIAFPSFVITMLFAAFLYLLINANVQAIARFLGDEGVIPILQWLSLLILIDASRAIPSALMRKQLLFGGVGKVGILYRITYTATSLTLAFLDFGVWSLVYAQIVSSSVRAIAYFWLSPGWVWLIPRRWDFKVVRDLLVFGIQNTFSGLLIYLHMHADDWLVGRMLGNEALGFYSKSYDLSNNTVNQISNNIIGSVFLSSYSKMHDDPPRLTRAYLKSVRLLLLIVAPLSFGLLAVAPEMVWVFWGDKWAPMIPVLQIYALMLLSRPISSNTVPLFQSLGKPKYNSRSAVVLLIIMLPLAFFLLPWEIVGVAVAVVISHFIGGAYNLYQVNTVLPGSSKLTIRAIIPPVISGFIMMTAVLLVKAPVQQLIGGQYNFLGLFILVGLGGLIYLPLSYFFQKQIILEIWHMTLSVFGKRFSFLQKTANSEAV